MYSKLVSALYPSNFKLCFIIGNKNDIINKYSFDCILLLLDQDMSNEKRLNNDRSY